MRDKVKLLGAFTNFNKVTTELVVAVCWLPLERYKKICYFKFSKSVEKFKLDQILTMII